VSAPPPQPHAGVLLHVVADVMQLPLAPPLPSLPRVIALCCPFVPIMRLYGRGGKEKRFRPDSGVPVASGQALVTIRSEDPEKLEAGRVAVAAIVSGFTQREFVVPDAVVGAILGKGGERISKLQADTDTSVDIVRGAVRRRTTWRSTAPAPAGGKGGVVAQVRGCSAGAVCLHLA
jgi:hypothetical protein